MSDLHARLMAQIEDFIACFANDTAQDLSPELARKHSDLSAALREVVADAERYRWLRNEAVMADPIQEGGEMVWCVIGTDAFNCHPCDEQELDTAIDSVRKYIIQTGRNDWNRTRPELATPPTEPAPQAIAECMAVLRPKVKGQWPQEQALEELYRAAVAQPAPQAGPADFSAPLHPNTDDLVNRFAAALKRKLALAEKKYGYSDGWMRADWMDECRAKLMEHIAKGDPRDVAAYCAFLWHHGASTAQAEPAAPRDWAKIEAIATEYIDGYTLEGDHGHYTPSDTERKLITDAMMGLLADDEFLAALAAAPHARKPLPVTDEWIDALVMKYRQRIYPQDMHPHFERTLVRAALASAPHAREPLAQAIAAERERCAKVCRDKASEWLARAEAGSMNKDSARHAHIAAGQIEAAILGA